ncbi:hypothetical protein [Photobacterium aquimaris]|uniref:hypothetical protein n=1 Tax=Photobacterium aquimaris TaxID=512643 RepID=UPI001F23524B|nr:hypothetical protein [Photobacterium aquimaris]
MSFPRSGGLCSRKTQDTRGESHQCSCTLANPELMLEIEGQKNTLWRFSSVTV